MKALTLLASLVIGLAAVVALVATPASAANVSFTLKADFDGWNFGQPGGVNPTLTANVGDTITVTIQRVNSIHNFAVYPPGYPTSSVSTSNPDAIVRSATVSSSNPTASVTFTINTPGTYEYYCEFHAFSMHGRLVIQGANAVPTLSNLGFTPGAPIPGQEVTLTALSTDLDGDRLQYSWTFGDGAAAAGLTVPGGGTISVAHAYMASGAFSSRLTVDDGKGGTASADLVVRIATPGLLRATTAVDLHPTFGVPGKILVDGVPADEWGLSWTKVAPGRHTARFTDVQNLATPDPISVDIVAGGTSEANGVYRANGWLRVVTDPPVPATISVDGVPWNDWGVWVAMPPGTYDVSFGPVAGFLPPAPRRVTVDAERLTTATGSYVSDPNAPGPDPQTFGLLRVTTRLSDGRLGVPTQISLNGVVRDEWGLNWVKLAPGTYTVSFSDVQDLGTPAPRTVEVVAGRTTVVEGVFEVHGWLRVVTDPAVPGTIFVDNVPRNDWGMWQSMRPGSYRVSFGPVPGFVTPAPQTVAVVAGQSLVVTARYTPATSPSATPLPSDPLPPDMGMMGGRLDAVALVRPATETRGSMRFAV